MNGEEIVRLYADMVYRIARHYVSNPADADDVFSEVFLAYFKKERAFDSEEHRKAWIIRVTINCAKTLLSGRVYTEELEEGIVGADETQTPAEEILDLHDAIRKLPFPQKEVITLYYMQEMSVRQIAVILDMTESNVKVTMFRAREKLKKYLEG